MRITTIIVVVMYVLLSLFHAYLGWWRYASITKALFRLVIDLAFPLFGFFFLWFCDVLALRKQKYDFAEMAENIYYNTDDLALLQEPNIKAETNRVAMKEALKFNSFDYRRNMVMQILMEDDVLQYLDVLHEALANEDTETSHYASTIIMELQRKTQEEISARRFAFEKDPDDPDKAHACESILYRVITTDLFDEHNRKRLYHDYQNVIQRIQDHGAMNEEYYMHALDLYLLMKNHTDAMVLVQSYVKEYPHSEDALLYQIRCLIAGKDSEGMRKLMSSLSSLPVVLTQKTLPYVRMFRKG